MLGVSRRTVVAWETTDAQPRASRIRKLAEILTGFHRLSYERRHHRSDLRTRERKSTSRRPARVSVTKRQRKWTIFLSVTPPCSQAAS